MEIQQKHKIIPPGGSVLDLGCSPGAWLQVACQSIGPPKRGGAVVGIDLTAMKAPQRYCDHRVHVLHGDARDLTPEILLEYTGPKVRFEFVCVMRAWCVGGMEPSPKHAPRFHCNAF